MVVVVFAAAPSTSSAQPFRRMVHSVSSPCMKGTPVSVRHPHPVNRFQIFYTPMSAVRVFPLTRFSRRRVPQILLVTTQGAKGGKEDTEGEQLSLYLSNNRQQQWSLITPGDNHFSLCVCVCVCVSVRSMEGGVSPAQPHLQNVASSCLLLWTSSVFF